MALINRATIPDQSPALFPAESITEFYIIGANLLQYHFRRLISATVISIFTVRSSAQVRITISARQCEGARHAVRSAGVRIGAPEDSAGVGRVRVY